MKTIERGHEVLHLNSAGRNLDRYLDHHFGHHLDNRLEKYTKLKVVVPLAIVLLTILVFALQYYFVCMESNLPNHLPNLPTFVDIPFA